MLVTKVLGPSLATKLLNWLTLWLMIMGTKFSKNKFAIDRSRSCCVSISIYQTLWPILIEKLSIWNALIPLIAKCTPSDDEVAACIWIVRFVIVNASMLAGISFTAVALPTKDASMLMPEMVKSRASVPSTKPSCISSAVRWLVVSVSISML